MRRVHKNLCPATVSASIMAANMWKNSLKNVESDNSKILYDNLLEFFLQQNGTYCLNKHRIILVLTGSLALSAGSNNSAYCQNSVNHVAHLIPTKSIW